MESCSKLKYARAEGETFCQETGWRETEYADVSVISVTSAETFADEKQIC
jgi:hypothetical protein